MLVKNNIKFATKCVFKSKVWFDIGKLLHRIFDGSEEGYNLWIMYSEFDEINFDNITCYETWVVFSPDWDFSYEEAMSSIVEEEEDNDEVDEIPEDY